MIDVLGLLFFCFFVYFVYPIASSEKRRYTVFVQGCLLSSNEVICNENCTSVALLYLLDIRHGDTVMS